MIYFQLFWNFFVIGCFSFGGGYAMLPLIDRLVTSHGWMSVEEFTEVIAISGMLPGSIGINAAVFVGFQTAGFTGAALTALGMVLPSFIIILLIGKFVQDFQDRKFIEQVFYGLRPVIMALIIFSAIKFALSMEIITSFSWKSTSFLIVFLIALGFLIFKKTHPMLVIFISGICGIILYY
ncbi:chromate transporter [Pueribacillus theae]|uniref:Chromate transporter n=1 Tax=Pueribacillus theae TaxID=2171751 RepID=A0A2U1JZK7_9BACI|nr:chromate transporter [Pueribacillus theae]PWA10379.1 chromate transporter [Pueribacillus theae]